MKRFDVKIRNRQRGLVKHIPVEAENRDMAMLKSIKYAYKVLKFKACSIMIENILEVGV